MKLLEGLGYVFLGIALLAVVGVLIAFPLMLLWNWLMPVIFGLPVITFWQALGLYMLAGVLVKSNASSKK